MAWKTPWSNAANRRGGHGSPTRSPDQPCIVSISKVRNEQDIIEPFLRHNSPLFDLMFVIDNMSTDRTREIALACSRELGNIVVTDDFSVGHDQSELVTRALGFIQGSVFADVVFFLDADEFLSSTDRKEVDSALAGVACHETALLPWKTLIVCEDGPVDCLKRVRARRKKERPAYYKVALRLDGRPVGDIVISQGNHRAHRGSQIVKQRSAGDLFLYHMPVRSQEQVTTKSVIGWAANLARQNLQEFRAKNQAYHRKRIVDDVLDRDGRISSDELMRLSVQYAQDEAPDWRENVETFDHPISTHRKYSDGSFGVPLALVSRAFFGSLEGAREVDLLARDPGRTFLPIPRRAGDGGHRGSVGPVDIPPVRFLFEKYAPASVLHYGCGRGAYVACFDGFGAERVLGVGSAPARETILRSSDYRRVRFDRPADLKERFDLVIATGAFEGAPPAHLLETLAGHARQRILYSFGGPGEDEKPDAMAALLKAWSTLGWAPNLADTLGLRAISTSSAFRRSLLVLEPVAEGDNGEATRFLGEIGRLKFGWHEQGERQWSAPFTEDYPTGEAGHTADPSDRPA